VRKQFTKNTQKIQKNPGYEEVTRNAPRRLC